MTDGTVKIHFIAYKFRKVIVHYIVAFFGINWSAALDAHVA
jgi:hypothetical protein